MEGSLDEECPGHLFEGVEKKLVLDFTGKGSMRDMKKSIVDTMFENACCRALSKTSNKIMDAYVLSESSCFVYEKRIVLKTCGTTEPIGAVPCILAAAQSQGLEVKSGMYCHMDFKFPKAQSPSYRSFDSERDLLQCYFSNAVSTKLVSGDNPAWNVYTHDIPTISCLEVLMYDLDRDVMDQFYKKDKVKNGKDSGDEVTGTTGTFQLAPDAEWDSFLFTPCGYSANAILDESYTTIHITPEEACSYASVEISPIPKDINSMVEQITKLYKPGHFAVIVSSREKLEGPATLHGHSTTAILSQEVAPGYFVWVGHFYCSARAPERAPSLVVTPPKDIHGVDYDGDGASKVDKVEDVVEDQKARVVVVNEDDAVEYSSSWENENETGTGSIMYEPRHKPSFELVHSNQVVG